MKITFGKTIILFLFTLLLVPTVALAHQPRITESRQTIVPDPEISKAYYGKLSGEPDVYVIEASEPFDLYVNILVPDIEGQKKDVSAAVIKDGNTEAPLAVLGGVNFEWEQFYEPFGVDRYWMGPEYKARAEAGKEMNVRNPLVLTWDDKRDMEKDGMTIKFRPLWEWLLEETHK